MFTWEAGFCVTCVTPKVNVFLYSILNLCHVPDLFLILTKRRLNLTKLLNCQLKCFKLYFDSLTGCRKFMLTWQRIENELFTPRWGKTLHWHGGPAGLHALAWSRVAYIHTHPDIHYISVQQSQISFKITSIKLEKTHIHFTKKMCFWNKTLQLIHHKMTLSTIIYTSNGNREKKRMKNLHISDRHDMEHLGPYCSSVHKMCLYLMLFSYARTMVGHEGNAVWERWELRQAKKICRWRDCHQGECQSNFTLRIIISKGKKAVTMLNKNFKSALIFSSLI